MSHTSAPDLFDLTFDAAREARLRLRFVVFCAIAMLPFAWGLYGAAPGLFRGTGRGHRIAVWVATLNGAVVAFYAGAVAWALRGWHRRARVAGLTLALTVAPAVLTLVAQRVILQVFIPGIRFRPDLTSALWSMAALAFPLLLPCLLIPWTVRESLVAAAGTVGATAGIALVNVLMGRAPAASVAVALLVGALAAAPGCLACWWRYSRFRGTLRLRYESDAYRRLRDELAGARRIHESCLPPPRRRGAVRVDYVYEPMHQIGGDLLFVVPATAGCEGHDPRDDARAVSVVVLDVTGHGIAAALSVNRIYGELRRLFGGRPDIGPGEVLAGLNEYVALTLSDHQIFATAICLRADPAASELRWASGGHPTAFVRRRDGRAEDLGSTAPMLGVIVGADFGVDEGRTGLAAGDGVLIYTDGASEACDRTGEMLGTAGMRRLLDGAASTSADAAAWPAAVLAAVAAHRGVAAAEDDTLVVSLFRAPVLAG